MFAIIANLEIKKNKKYIKEIEDYLKTKNINCELATVKQDSFGNYIYMYEHFVKGDFGNMKVQEVEKSDIRRLYNGFVNEAFRYKSSIVVLEVLTDKLSMFTELKEYE